MNSQIQRMTGSLSRVAMHPAQPRGKAVSARQTASKVLALTGILQTTLEINELMALFAKELVQFVEFDGLDYSFDSLNILISLGDRHKHSCEYRLIVSGEELGNLKLYRHHPFDSDEMETTENLLAALLYPLRNALLYRRAVQTSMIDPLTGVKNRSTMEDALAREIELSKRQDSSLSVVLLDIDHFKLINDRFGHLYGDQALRAVAQCTAETIRESDMLFRYGGEEFLIMLSGTDLSGSTRLAERIRSRIQQLSPHPDKDMHLTVSLGVTLLREDDDITSLFERVDAALYQAKRQGRNRVVAD